MIYSIWPSASRLVEEAGKDIDFSKFPDHAGMDWIKEYWNANFKEIRASRLFKKKVLRRGKVATVRLFRSKKDVLEFFGRYEDIARAFYGPHPYEAKITMDMQREILCKEFLKPKFAFKARQISGHRVDIPRFLAGDQRCWFATRRQLVEVPSVRVFACFGGSGKKTKEELAVSGAVACAVVEELESNGINVELWAACCVSQIITRSTNPQQAGEKGPTDICQLIKLKDASEYYDPGLINYVLGNNHFYRNVIFRDRVKTCVKYAHEGRFMYSSGVSYDFTKDLIPESDDYSSAQDIVIPRLYDIISAKVYFRNNFGSEDSKVFSDINKMINERSS